MTKESLDQIIRKTAKETANEMLKMLQSNNKNNKSQDNKDCFKQTERLLYAYNEFKETVKNYNEEIDELQKYGLREKSKSIVYMPSGSRLTKDDLLEAKILDLNYKIQNTQREIKKIENGLKAVELDSWYGIIELKYFQGLSDKDIADIDEYRCDPSTIRRHKNRLVNKIAIRLFGADAI